MTQRRGDLVQAAQACVLTGVFAVLSDDLAWITLAVPNANLTVLRPPPTCPRRRAGPVAGRPDRVPTHSLAGP